MMDMYDAIFASKLNGGSPVDYSIDGFGYVAYNTPAYGLSDTYNWNQPFEIQACAVTMLSHSAWANRSRYNKHLIGPWGQGYSTPRLYVNIQILGYDPVPSVVFVAPNPNSTTEIDTIGKELPQTALPQNKPVWFRIGYDGGEVGVGKIYLKMSSDGKTFELLGEKVITAAMGNGITPLAFGGYDPLNASADYQLSTYMALILNECYVKLNGEYVWGRG